VILAEPRIMVLDDTLSALDVHTEALVEAALREVLAQATGIVVAHRASTVLLADKVALLEDGTITAVGRHSDLLESVPAYRELLAPTPSCPDALEEAPDEQQGLARRRRRDMEDGRGRRRRSSSWPLPPPSRLAAATAHRRRSSGPRHRAARERRTAGDPVAGQGGHRPRYPAHAGRRQQRHARC
jgi:ABC-type multidrug transport system ATPase subunit